MRPRFGWTEHNWLIYATGGLAVGRENFSQAVGLLGGIVMSNNFSTTQVGWTAGAGVEGKLTPTLSVKLEYLYYDLGNTPSSTSVFNPIPGIASAGSTTMRLTSSTVRLGLNWQFDHLSLFWPER